MPSELPAAFSYHCAIIIPVWEVELWNLIIKTGFLKNLSSKAA